MSARISVRTPLAASMIVATPSDRPTENAATVNISTELLEGRIALVSASPNNITAVDRPLVWLRVALVSILLFTVASHLDGGLENCDIQNQLQTLFQSQSAISLVRSSAKRLLPS